LCGTSGPETRPEARAPRVAPADRPIAEGTALLSRDVTSRCGKFARRDLRKHRGEAPSRTDHEISASFDREAGATGGGWTRFRMPGAYRVFPNKGT
jgi:hypothetical protein